MPQLVGDSVRMVIMSNQNPERVATSGGSNFCMSGDYLVVYDKNMVCLG